MYIFFPLASEVVTRTEESYMVGINGFIDYKVPAGGVYSSSVTSQASRAATELVPTAALVRASPMVNCSSVCLACNEGDRSQGQREHFKNIHFHKKAAYWSCFSACFVCFHSCLERSNRMVGKWGRVREQGAQE